MVIFGNYRLKIGGYSNAIQNFYARLLAEFRHTKGALVVYVNVPETPRTHTRSQKLKAQISCLIWDEVLDWGGGGSYDSGLKQRWYGFLSFW